MTTANCQCECGQVEFEAGGQPLFRLLCHCTICQRFNDAPHADVVVYAASDVSSPEPGSVDYDTYKPPPNVQRGKCAACGTPAIEHFAMPLLPRLTMVPAAVHGTDVALPEPVAHVFYDKRLADADDSLPKHSGFVRSQLAFVRHLREARRREGSR